ncbi:hypothetical protein CKAH01_13201 [Colletotrichum kahawae]|uniref:Uncharacterized protein n=1 Tax=Colletotrichum kahawae TaxID=34407 RepID=A0AAD9YRC3_COLKA|nr:hypothetical protein CKAH01_13201 [Colletotrichum kahawae]
MNHAGARLMAGRGELNCSVHQDFDPNMNPDMDLDLDLTSASFRSFHGRGMKIRRDQRVLAEEGTYLPLERKVRFSGSPGAIGDTQNTAHNRPFHPPVDHVSSLFIRIPVAIGIGTSAISASRSPFFHSTSTTQHPRSDPAQAPHTTTIAANNYSNTGGTPSHHRHISLPRLTPPSSRDNHHHHHDDIAFAIKLARLRAEEKDKRHLNTFPTSNFGLYCLVIAVVQPSTASTISARYRFQCFGPGLGLAGLGPPPHSAGILASLQASAPVPT